jgi:hypothetical protein
MRQSYRRETQGEVDLAHRLENKSDHTTWVERELDDATRSKPLDVFSANNGDEVLHWTRCAASGFGPESPKLRGLTNPALGWLSLDRDWIASTFEPKVMETVQCEGETYALPVGIHRINTLFYNKELFEKAGYDVGGGGRPMPSTLPELHEAAAAVNEHLPPPNANDTLRPSAFAVAGREAWTVSLFVIENLMLALAADGEEYQRYWRGEECNEALLERTLRELALLQRAGFFGNTDLTAAEARDRVASGQAAMLVTGDWAMAEFDAEDVGEMPFPGTGQYFVFSADVFALPAIDTADVQNGLAWLRSTTLEQTQRDFALTKSARPARVDVAAELSPPGAASHAHSRRSCPISREGHSRSCRTSSSTSSTTQTTTSACSATHGKNTRDYRMDACAAKRARIRRSTVRRSSSSDRVHGKREETMNVAVARRPIFAMQRAPSRRVQFPKRRCSTRGVPLRVKGHATPRVDLVAHRRPTPLATACRAPLMIQIAVWLAASCLELRSASADALPRTPEPGSPVPTRALELRVTYRAPEQCPTGTDFLDALRAHLTAGGEGPVDADVRIARLDEAAFELVLRLRVAGREAESVVRAESCAPLVQLAALSASMARIRPAAPAPSGSSPELGSLSAAAAADPGAHETEPAPDLDLAAGDEQHRAADAPRPLHLFALAELATTSGMLPGTALGRGLAAGIDLGLWSARLAATSWVPQKREFSFGGSSPITLEFEQQSLELEPCALPSLATFLRVGGCASFAAHRIWTSAERARLIGSVEAGARAVLSPWRGLRLEGHAGLRLVVNAPGFDIEVLRSVYESKTLQPSARVAVGWEFGAP